MPTLYGMLIALLLSPPMYSLIVHVFSLSFALPIQCLFSLSPFLLSSLILLFWSLILSSPSYTIPPCFARNVVSRNTGYYFPHFPSLMATVVLVALFVLRH